MMNYKAFLLLAICMMKFVAVLPNSNNNYGSTLNIQNIYSVIDTTIINIVYNTIDFDSIKISDVTFVNCSFFNCDFSNGEIKKSIFNKCTLENKEYIHNMKLGEVIISDSKVEFAFSNCSISKLYIANCTISELKFLGCKIDTLEIRYSNITKLHLVNNELNSVIVLGDVVDEIILNNNIASNIQLIAFTNTNFLIKGGKYTYLNIDDIKTNNFIEIQNAILSYPDFSISSIPYINMINIATSESNLTLKLEKDTDEHKYSYNQSRYNYIEARNIYSIMRSNFAKYNIDDIERELNYKIHIIDNKLETSTLLKYYDFLFNDLIRGGYGLFPERVLLTGLFFLIIFSCLYFSLGMLRIGWSFLLYADGLGNTYLNLEPTYLDIKNYSILQYFILCFIFSFEQFMIIGFSVFKISSLLKGFKYVPSYFIPVGIGRPLSTIQNIIGLVILISFVQAFINII